METSYLQKKWQNMKYTARKANANFRKEIHRTGGGKGPKALALKTAMVLVSLEAIPTYLYNSIYF